MARLYEAVYCVVQCSTALSFEKAVRVEIKREWRLKCPGECNGVKIPM